MVIYNRFKYNEIELVGMGVLVVKEFAMREIVYELPNGTQERFEVSTEEEEAWLRTVAEFALRQGDAVDYHFEGEYENED